MMGLEKERDRKDRRGLRMDIKIDLQRVKRITWKGKGWKKTGRNAGKGIGPVIRWVIDRKKTDQRTRQTGRMGRKGQEGKGTAEKEELVRLVWLGLES